MVESILSASSSKFCGMCPTLNSNSSSGDSSRRLINGVYMADLPRSVSRLAALLLLRAISWTWILQMLCAFLGVFPRGSTPVDEGKKC